MQNTYYTDERNVQMLIYLLKQHGVRKIIVSPGATNITFVASIQQDSYFEIYSSVDERSAAYIACGMSAESGEPVALSCTGATASRNYIPGLTEAFYRKLPVLAITSTQHIGKIGQNIPQVIDRSNLANDIAKLSVQIPTIHDKEDEWAYSIILNKALLELKHRGGGPVHINLTTMYSTNYNIKELPVTRIINRITNTNEIPKLDTDKVGIFVGAHEKWSNELTEVVDLFCEIYNGVVLCDHTSNYNGKYGVLASLVTSQSLYAFQGMQMNIMVDIGNTSGAYLQLKPKTVWRINPDGEVRDSFRKLRYVFEMEEIDFFKNYIALANGCTTSLKFYHEWKNEYDKLIEKIPELPFSNVWVAQNTITKLPEDCRLHLAILNTLRTWNYFKKSKSILSFSNTGGFGIDGGISSLLGASLVAENQLYYGITGDLAFFYDMNAIGNRHIGKNIRIMIINNGKGTEFRNYSHLGARFGENANNYIAAAGHYGNQSNFLIKNYAENLGFEYMSAHSKNDFLSNLEHFLSPISVGESMIFEVFTNSKDESDAIKTMCTLEKSTKGKTKQILKEIIGEQGVKKIKSVIG